MCFMTLAAESGLTGRCVQDVVTQPPRKWARIQGSDGFVEWTCGHAPGVDQVEAALPGRVASVQRVAKTRPDDFIEYGVDDVLHIPLIKMRVAVGDALDEF
jgi:hypothetical protein